MDRNSDKLSVHPCQIQILSQFFLAWYTKTWQQLIDSLAVNYKLYRNSDKLIVRRCQIQILLSRFFLVWFAATEDSVVVNAILNTIYIKDCQ